MSFNKAAISLKKNTPKKFLSPKISTGTIPKKTVVHKKNCSFSKREYSKFLSFKSDYFPSKTIQRLQDEIIEYRNRSEEFQKEIKSLNKKIKETSSYFFRKKSSQEIRLQNGGAKDASGGLLGDPKFISEITSTYDVLIDLIELFLSSKASKNATSNRILENTSCSIDIYEPSINNEDDRRSVLIEQITQLILFKLNFLNSVFKLDLKKQIEKVNGWNFSKEITVKEKENISNLSIFSNLSSYKNKNTTFNNSVLSFDCNSVRNSPKFFRKDSVDSNRLGSLKDEGYSNIIDESTIKEFNQSIIRANNEKHIDDFLSIDGDGEYSRTRKQSNVNLIQPEEAGSYIKEEENNEKRRSSFINTSFKDLICRVNSENGTSQKEDEKNNKSSEDNTHVNQQNGGDEQKEFSLSEIQPVVQTNGHHELSFNDI